MSMEDERFEENRRPTAGIDWASADHSVAVVDADGLQRDRFVVAHTASALRRLVDRLHRAGVGGVAIERPDGPVVDALLDAGLEVFGATAPNTVKSLRGRRLSRFLCKRSAPVVFRSVLQVGVDAVGVDDGGAQGLLPVRHDLALDELSGALRSAAGRPFSLARSRARLSSMLQIASHSSLITASSLGKCPRFLMTLRKRVVQRLDAVGRVDHPPQLGREREERDVPFPRGFPGRHRVGVLLAPIQELRNALNSSSATLASGAV